MPLGKDVRVGVLPSTSATAADVILRTGVDVASSSAVVVLTPADEAVPLLVLLLVLIFEGLLWCCFFLGKGRTLVASDSSSALSELPFLRGPRRSCARADSSWDRFKHLILVTLARY